MFTFGISTFPGVEEEVEGKGRSRQDERHNVQNEARCDPADATALAAGTRDAPDVSISGTLCSPLTFTLSPAIAPATGVTHSAHARLRGAAKSADGNRDRCCSMFCPKFRELELQFELQFCAHISLYFETVSIFEFEHFSTEHIVRGKGKEGRKETHPGFFILSHLIHARHFLPLPFFAAAGAGAAGAPVFCGIT